MKHTITGARGPADITDSIRLGGAILEALPLAAYVCDAEGRITGFNQRAVELWGRTPAQHDTDKRFCGAHRLFRPDGTPLPHAQTPMAAALRSGVATINEEVIIEQPGGRRIWVMVNIKPLRGDDGVVRGAVNCFQEVTQIRLAEQEDRGRREFLETILTLTPECVYLVSRDGFIERVNEAGVALAGADDLSDVVGRHIDAFVAPEHQALWRECLECVCDGRKLAWEYEIIGLNGRRRRMETNAAPITMPDGEIALLGVARDVSHRKEYEDELREGRRRFSELLEALPAPIYTTDADGRITYCNQAAAEFWGRRPTIGESLWCGGWKLFHPDGSPMRHEDCPTAVALRENRAVRDVEVIAERPDGTRLPYQPYPTPLHDADGRLIGAVNMLVDISHHKRAEARQQVLIHELNHRVKNTLATVQSIAMQTLRHAKSAEEFRESFEARLLALSSAHDLLTRGRWESAQLRDVICNELRPYVAEDMERVAMEGEDTALAPRAALTLALVFHELTTNAAKHGALSTPEGRLSVEWHVTKDAAGRPERLALRWTEMGGPRVETPRRRGLGTRLLEKSLKHELRGETSMDYAPEGARCEFKIPLAMSQS